MPLWPTGKSLECMTPGNIFAVIQKLSISISEGKNPTKLHSVFSLKFFKLLIYEENKL